MRTVFIYSGFAIGVILAVLGCLLLFGVIDLNPDGRKTLPLPGNMIGLIMVLYGGFRFYRSWIAYQRDRS